MDRWMELLFICDEYNRVFASVIQSEIVLQRCSLLARCSNSLHCNFAVCTTYIHRIVRARLSWIIEMLYQNPFPKLGNIIVHTLTFKTSI